jgi:hypothetical protein
MRAKPILLVSGTCIVGALAVHLATQLSTPSAVSAKVAPAREPVTTSEQRQAEHRESPPIAARPASPVAPASEPAAAPRQEQQIAKIDASLAERLRGERVDAAWARETESAIARTLAAPSFTGFRLDALTCAATMCRVALTAAETVPDVDGALEELTSTQPFRHGGFVHFTSKRALTMFVARKGHRLPPPPRT